MHPAHRNPTDVVLTQDSRRAALVLSFVAGTIVGSIAGAATAKQIGKTALVFPLVGAMTGVAAWGLTWATGYPIREFELG